MSAVFDAELRASTPLLITGGAAARGYFFSK
jgi:hypothetical protein